MTFATLIGAAFTRQGEVGSVLIGLLLWNTHNR